LATKVKQPNGLELVIVPIRYKSDRKPGKLIWSDKTPENEKNPKIENVLDVRENLLTYKDPSGQLQSEIFQLIPSKDYKKQKKEGISKNDFSGWIMAFTWNEEFITGFEFKNGKKIRDLLNPGKARGGRPSSCEYYYSSSVTSYCYPGSGCGACTMCDVYITGQWVATCTMPSSDSGTNTNYGPDYGGGGWYYGSSAPPAALTLDITTAATSDLLSAITAMVEELTPEERVLLGENLPGYRDKLVIYYLNAAEAVARTYARFNSYQSAMEDATGRANAYKHAILAIIHARSLFGRPFAETLVNAHETSACQSDECIMDRWNNSQGFSVYDANQSLNLGTLDDNVWIRHNNGNLRYIKNNVLTPTNQ
jgi:hypothetical protein